MDSKKKSFLKCKICFVIYDDEKRKPIVLPCGHTICQECFKKLSIKAKNTKIINCPFDQKGYDPKNASTNFSLMEALNDSEGSEERKDQAFDKCNFHKNEDLMFYCKNDDVVICTKCIISKHNGSLHEIYCKEDVESSRLDIIKEITTKLEEVEKRTGELQNFLSNITDKCQAVNTNLNAFRKKVIAKVENWCSNYIEKVDTHYAEKVELLMQQLEDLHDISASGNKILGEYKSKLMHRDKEGTLKWLKEADRNEVPFGCTKNNCVLFSWEKNQESWLSRDLADFLVETFRN